MSKNKILSFQDYKRVPIIVGRDTVALIKMLTCDFQPEDMWLSDFISDYPDFKDSAKQFFDQFEGHCCDAFLMAMRDEADSRIDNRIK